jgi:hypothetical protein
MSRAVSNRILSIPYVLAFTVPQNINFMHKMADTIFFLKKISNIGTEGYLHVILADHDRFIG